MLLLKQHCRIRLQIIKVLGCILSSMDEADCETDIFRKSIKCAPAIHGFTRRFHLHIAQSCYIQCNMWRSSSSFLILDWFVFFVEHGLKLKTNILMESKDSYHSGLWKDFHII